MGVVLAGGASRRMGRDKAALELGGETLVARVAAALAAACSEVVLADRGRAYLPHLPSVPDGPGAGPAAGILGAAAARPGRDLLVLACDLPRVPTALLRALAAAPRADWVVPVSPRGPEPLCALYRPRAVEALAAQVAAGVFALHRLAATPGLTLCRFTAAALAPFGDPAEMFANLNRPEDLEGFR